MSPRIPQSDDWRCYRCREWRRSSDLRAVHITPSGITLALCRECHERSEPPATTGSTTQLLTR